MKLLEAVNKLDPSRVKAATQIIYTEKDDTIDVKAIPGYYDRLTVKEKQLYHMEIAHRHEIAGDPLAPEMNKPTEDIIFNFLDENVLRK